uniref:Uncharacterized protein n=1 Tax=Trichobilharzia regenti TaxID=157069 RepID=A0AA85JMI5_TRIRE|nr:unnamed protein product [Trichobilharzia regenti]
MYAGLHYEYLAQKLCQLAKEKQILTEENVKLRSHFESAEKTYKELSSELAKTRQKLNNLSDGADINLKLLKCLEDEKTSKSDLQLLLEEEKSRNVQLKAQLAMAKEEVTKLVSEALKYLEPQISSSSKESEDISEIIENRLARFRHTIGNTSANVKNVRPSLCWHAVRNLMNNITRLLLITSMNDLTIKFFIFLCSIVLFCFTILRLTVDESNLCCDGPVQKGSVLDFYLYLKYLLRKASKNSLFPGKLFSKLSHPFGVPAT